MNKIITLLSIILILSSCGVHKTIYVADSFADCEGQSSQKCLKVKEAPEDDWTLLHDPIEGFDYKEGSTYKIEVKATKIKNPSADGSNLKYKLIKIIYQEKSKMSQETASFNGNWKVSKLIGLDSLTKSPTLNIDFDTKKISGNAGCNSYGSSFVIKDNEVKFELIAATKMYCTNMNIEKAFFDCLQKTSSYKIIDGQLKLYAKDGEEQMTCHISEK
jgi:heat shock protein HslJ